MVFVRAIHTLSRLCTCGRHMRWGNKVWSDKAGPYGAYRPAETPKTTCFDYGRDRGVRAVLVAQWKGQEDELP